jgi:hypothetical protein
MDLKSILGEEVSSAADVMQAVRSMTDEENLKKIASIIETSSPSKETINRDDLLSYYVGHEIKFTHSQKSIMATVVDASFSGGGDLDRIITHGIVHGEDVQCLPRLERTMKHCVSMYQPPQQSFSPMQLYGAGPPLPGGAYGNAFNK